MAPASPSGWGAKADMAGDTVSLSVGLSSQLSDRTLPVSMYSLRHLKLGTVGAQTPPFEGGVGSSRKWPALSLAWRWQWAGFWKNRFAAEEVGEAGRKGFSRESDQTQTV